MGYESEDADERSRSLAAFEEMLDFLVIRLSEASDALGLPHENGELNRALEELSALMNDLAEDLVESPSHRRALLRTALPKLLGAMLFRTYDGEPERVFLAVEEALQGVARALAKVLPVTDGAELEGACESLVLLFDKRQNFYRQAGTRAACGSSAIAGAEGAELLSFLSEEEWRAKVGFADWVDAVCTGTEADVRRWRRAQVIEEDPAGQLRLSFDGLSDYHNVWISRDSPDIAPPGTRSGQEVERWRHLLERGSLVDALDPTNTWTNATVMGIRERSSAPVVLGLGGPISGNDANRGQDLLIGYRVYHPDGDFEEAVNEDHEPRGEASLVPGTYVSTDARRKELDAMAAAATLGGLARRGRAEVAVAVAGGPHEAGDGIMEDAAVYMDPILDLDLAEPALRDAGGDIASVEAPAAGGLGIVGRLRGRGQGGAPGRVAISDGLGVELGQGVRGPGMIHRYFGLALPNEWIPASSSRIEKLNSKASWGRSWTEEAPVNDRDDPYLTDDGQLVFAVQRAPVDGGPRLVDSINTFGQEGGFENLILRLAPPEHLPVTATVGHLPVGEDHSTQPQQQPQTTAEAGEIGSVSKKETAAAAATISVPLEAVRNALVAISSIRPLLARLVAKAIIDRTATAAWTALKDTCESELRGLTRERLEGVVHAFRELLKRGHRISVAFRRVQRLQLDLALKLYSCPFMERKLQGLKVIADAVAATTTTTIPSSTLPGAASALTPQELVDWLDENKFVQALFAGHTQLIRRSGDVVGFLCRQKALSVEHLDMIWAAGGIGQDKDRRICVHEVLRPLLYEMDMGLLERLVDKLRVQPPDEVIGDTVTFIKEIAEATQEDEGAPAIRLVDLLWAMVDDGSLYRPRIKSGAAECILVVTGLRGLKGYRAQSLERCVKNINEKRAVVTSLKVMEAILNHFPKDTTTFEHVSRSGVIHRLEAEHGLTELLLRELESYVVSSRSTSTRGRKILPSLPTPSILDPCGRPPSTGSTNSSVADDEGHLSQVKARLHTLEHLCDNSRLVLSTKQIKRLWACLGPGPTSYGYGHGGTADGGSVGEVSTLLSWLSKACEACDGQGGGGMFEPGVAAELFKELIVSDGERKDFAAHCASPEWFACFQTFFFKVNRQAGRMCVDAPAASISTISDVISDATASTTVVEAVALAQTPIATPTEMPAGPIVVGNIAPVGEAEARRPEGVAGRSELQDTGPWDVKGTTSIAAIEGQVVHAMIPRDPDAPLDMLVVPSGLSGMRALWNVALEAQDDVVVDQATKLLNRTHEELAPALRDCIGEIREDYIRTCMAYIKGDDTKEDEAVKDQNGDDGTSIAAAESAAHRQRSVVRALHLMEELVDESEKRGTGGLRGHGARARGSKMVVLSFDNKVLESTPLPSSFKIEMHSNSEVWEVRRRVARMALMPTRSIELKIMAKPGASASAFSTFSSFSNDVGTGTGAEKRTVEALDRDNSRRLRDLGLRSDDLWVVTRRKRPAMPRVQLLSASGQLVRKAEAIFKTWFHEYENADGMMDRLGAANFIDSCCHDQCKPSDERVSKFFRNYDANGDGLLTVNDFLRLFQDSCKNIPEVVWSNLEAHHYREDLTRAVDEDVLESEGPTNSRGHENGNADIIPRSIISRDSRSVDRLLSVLSLGGSAASAAWRFLMRLPTNPDMLEGVRKLEGFRVGGVLVEGESGCAKWKELLGLPGSHRMLYTLQIVDGVLDFVEAGVTGDGGATARSEWEDMDYTRWVADFVRSGGLRYLCEAILSRGLFGDSNPRGMVDTQQACLALILKVVRIFLMGVLSVPPEAREAGTDRSGEAQVALNETDRESMQATPSVRESRGSGVSTPDIDEIGAVGNGKSLWASLPRDVVDAVLGAVDVSELQTRLVELAGVAADIADARASSAQPPIPTATVMADRPGNAFIYERGSRLPPPLDLYGCVGEGAPADSMAREALDLWVGVSRAPTAVGGTLSVSLVEGSDGQIIGDGGEGGCGSRDSLDEAVLKAIFCASDGIRVRLSQSLLQVCGAADAAVTKAEAERHEGVSTCRERTNGTVHPPHELREHVVHLLLDNIPRPYSERREEEEGGITVKGRVNFSQPISKMDCTQLFDVLCTLVSASIEEKSREGVQRDAMRRLDVDELASIVVERLLAHPCTEKRGAREEDKDTLLVGLLKLGVTVVQACPSAARVMGDGLVESLLDDFLFAPPTPASTVPEALAPTRPKCKTVASRAMAYKLLAAVCKPQSRVGDGRGEGREHGSASGGFDPRRNLQLLLEKGLNPLREFLSKPDVWGYNPSSGERSTVGRVGLRNLGNTCYVNSCLQQLFMMEPVRNSLSSLGEGETKLGSLVGELQKLFGQLALSEKQAVDPSSFLRTMKDLDGNPIDVSVQQDAQGFLLDLFDKLEAGLKGTPQSSLLMSTFEGTQITQLICPKPATITDASTGPPRATVDDSNREGVGNGDSSAAVKGQDQEQSQGDRAEEFDTRERGETFMCLSLEVKNMVGVEDALEKLTEKEVIEGYTWDDKRRDVSIHRRTVLGKLPPNVVLHLNRFKMNLDTFQTEKINTRFDFPMRLDLEPFTKEGLAWRERVEAAGGRGAEDAKRLGLPGPYEVHPRSYYTYRLRGVVVHTGTANQGHYFSYIRHPSIPDPGLDNQATHASSHGASANPGDTDTPMPPPPPAGSPSTTSLSLSVDGSAGSGSAAGDEAKEAGEGLDGATTPSPISCPAPDDPPGGVAQDVDDVVASEVNVSADVEEAGDTDDDDWCEFNDTIVKEWRTHVTGDVSKDGVDGRMSGLEADCFGGQQNMQETDEYGWPRKIRKDNIQNAYLLFYERVDQGSGIESCSNRDRASGHTNKSSSKSKSKRANATREERHRRTTPTWSVAGATARAGVDADGDGAGVSERENEREARALQSTAAAVPPGVFRAVWDDNNKFLLDRQLFHPDMSTFVLEVLSSVREMASEKLSNPSQTVAQAPDSAPALIADAIAIPNRDEGRGLEKGFLEWGITYALENLARAMENDVFPRVLEQLKGLYNLNPDAVGAFLDAETDGGMQRMREMMLQCPDRPVRVAMKELYLHLFGILAESEGDRYLHYEQPKPRPPTTAVAESQESQEPLPMHVGPVEENNGSAWVLPAADEKIKGRPYTRLGRVVLGWLGLLPDAARSWVRFEQFLELVEGVSDMGDRERDLLLHRRMVCRLSSFILQDSSPVLDPKKRLPKMGHKSAHPRFSPLVRCLKTLRAHSGETALSQPREAGHAESESDTAYDSEGTRSDDSISSMTAVRSMPVGPAVTFLDDKHTPLELAKHPVDNHHHKFGDSPGVSTAVQNLGVSREAVSLGGNCGDNDDGNDGGMTAKDRARSLALSPNCRRCLSCEKLYDLAYEQQHAPEAAAELMCSWAADSTKLLRPLSCMIVHGVDTTPFVDLDSWLDALRSWLELEDTLQEDRLRQVLGTGKQDSEPKLLFLMIAQKEKYEKWLFRVLMVLIDLLVNRPAVARYVSKLHSHDMLPWADWITKHLNDTYGSLRVINGPTRVKDEDLIQMKEKLREYELKYHGRTAEERLLEMATKARLGPAEGEPGVTRIESLTSNGVQVEMLDLSDIIPGATEIATIAGESPPGAWRRFWRVTNYRLDSVNFTFIISPTPQRLENMYPYRRPNYHIPWPVREIKMFLKPRDSRVILEVDKIDLNKEFGPWPFKWEFEAAQTEPADPVVTASELLERQAQLEGDLGDAARVALEAERQEEAQARAEAEAANKADEEMALAQAVATAAASLPGVPMEAPMEAPRKVPMEVVSKVNADGAAASLEGKVGEAGLRLKAQVTDENTEEESFWGSDRHEPPEEELLGEMQDGAHERASRDEDEGADGAVDGERRVYV